MAISALNVTNRSGERALTTYIKDGTTSAILSKRFGAVSVPDLGISLTYGTGSGQANKLYIASRTVTATTADNLDLAGSLSDGLGNTITFTAGDAVGATPPLSGFFQDAPAIRAMRPTPWPSKGASTTLPPFAAKLAKVAPSRTNPDDAGLPEWHDAIRTAANYRFQGIADATERRIAPRQRVLPPGFSPQCRRWLRSIHPFQWCQFLRSRDPGEDSL